MKKAIIISLVAGVWAVSAMAQISSTLSPYSQFGLGTLSDQSQGANRGMNGLGIGLRNGRIANMTNPASYSAIDSLTMILDLGVSGQVTNFKEGGKKMNRRTADFDYATILFRVMPKVGVSLGVAPYSNIGYNYYNTDTSNNNLTNVTTYTGSGGFSQAYIGAGWELVKGFSVGANFSYFWGKYEKTVSNVLNETYANTLLKTYTANVNSWKLDLGAQWWTMLDAKNRLTVGATFGIGHKLGADPAMSIVNVNSQTGISTSTTDSISNGLSIPYTYGVGVSLLHNNSLTIGVDYTLQKWGSIDYPQVNEQTQAYQLTSGLLKDRHKVTIGADWVPRVMGRRFFDRVHYRLGASYATPYYNIGNTEGPKELSVGGGFGIPIANSYNNRSVLNISAQWVHASTDKLTENSFRINLGLTFNERWFAKWKVE